MFLFFFLNQAVPTVIPPATSNHMSTMLDSINVEAVKLNENAADESECGSIRKCKFNVDLTVSVYQVIIAFIWLLNCVILLVKKNCVQHTTISLVLLQFCVSINSKIFRLFIWLKHQMPEVVSWNYPMLSLCLCIVTLSGIGFTETEPIAVCNVGEIRRLLMPTWKIMYHMMPHSMLFRQPVDTSLVPVSGNIFTCEIVCSSVHSMNCVNLMHTHFLT